MERPVVFLPWRGEFGQMIMHFVRWVHAHPAPAKIVCCRRGDEALYPSATGFFYEWAEVEDRLKKTSFLKGDDNRQYLEELSKVLETRYPYAEILEPPKRRPAQRCWNFKPAARLSDAVPCMDVCLAPRYREHGEHRNYQHWSTLVDDLHGHGLVVGLVGARATSVNLPQVPAELKAWHYDNLNTHLGFMNQAKLTVTTDSGMAHLAVLNQVPLKVIYDAPGVEAGKPEWPWAYPHMKDHAVTHCEPILYGWNDPTEVLEQVLIFLRREGNDINTESPG